MMKKILLATALGVALTSGAQAVTTAPPGWSATDIAQWNALFDKIMKLDRKPNHIIMGPSTTFKVVPAGCVEERHKVPGGTDVRVVCPPGAGAPPPY